MAWTAPAMTAVGRYAPLGALGIGVNLEQGLEEGALRGAFVLQKFGNLELVEAAMTDRLPFVTDEKTAVGAIKDQCPPIFIPRRRATGAAVELSLDNGHGRSLACFPMSIGERSG
jgi:hypothetical protein